jgi:hypothetical protein
VGDLPFVAPLAPGDPASEEAALRTNQDVVRSSTIEDWLPTFQRGDEALVVGPVGTGGARAPRGDPLLSCDQVRRPTSFSGLGMVSVLSIQLGSGDEDPLGPTDATGVLATGDSVYASASNLYVTTVRAPDAPPEVAAATTTTLAPDDPAAQHRTAVHKFDLTGDGPAVYVASGDVEGRVLDAFALSEHDGHLRVASTTGPGWGGGPVDESRVSVLAERGGALEVVGSVVGLGTNEQIRAVRFVGPIGYVVTFRQVDPLYTLDLSDPTAPRLAGELKVLGYSAYLHPVADGRLLGVGRDATEEGVVGGTKVALYDVSDPAAPQELSALVVPDGFALAEDDHHGFVWWDPSALAVVPVRTAQGGAAIGYTVAADGVQEIGRVVNPTHGAWCPPGSACVVPGGVQCAADGTCTPPTRDDPDAAADPVLRSLVVGDLLLTVSRGGVLSSALDTLAPLVWTPAPGS